MWRAVGVLACAALVAACQASVRGEPERSFVETRNIVRLAVEHSLSEGMVRQALGPGATRAQRDHVVFARLTEIDSLYNDYEQAVTRELRESGFAATLAGLGLGIGGTFAGTTGSQVLSGLSAGVTGAREAFEKEILIDRTVQALTAQMRANRSTVKARIIEKLQADVVSYPLIAALSDLEAYRQAGTITGALLGISEGATAAEAQARESLAAAEDERFVFFRDAAFVARGARDRIQAIWEAITDRERTSDARILELANAPPAGDDNFDAVLASFRRGQPAFTNANDARRGLEESIEELERTDQNLSAWERALTIE